MCAVLRADVGDHSAAMSICRCRQDWRGMHSTMHAVLRPATGDGGRREMSADVGAWLVWMNVVWLIAQHRAVERRRAGSSTVVCVVCAGRICDLQVRQGIFNMVVLLTSVGSFCQRPFKFGVECRNCELQAGQFFDAFTDGVETELVYNLPRHRPVNVDLAADHVGVRPHRPRADPRLFERRDDVLSVGRLVESGQDFEDEVGHEPSSLPGRGSTEILVVDLLDDDIIENS